MGILCRFTAEGLRVTRRDEDVIEYFLHLHRASHILAKNEGVST